MFKIGIAHSLTAQLDVAAQHLVEQAQAQLDGLAANVALLFSTYGRDHTTLLAGVTRRLPTCTVVGGSSNGEVSRQQGYRTGSALLILLASDRVRMLAGVLRDLSFDDDASNLAAAQRQLPHCLACTETANATAPVLGLLFPDGIGLDGAAVVRLFASQYPTTRFFGGATAEDFHLSPTQQFFNQELLHNSVPYVLFYGPLRYHWAVTEGLSSGWRAVGERMHAHCEGKWIKTIDQQPATHFLERRYQLSGGLLSVCHPFVIYPNPGSDEHYFRDVIRYDAASGALEALQQLPPACQVQLTQPDPQAILQTSRQNILQALSHFPGTGLPAAVLWFSCVNRALVLHQDPASEFRTAVQDLPANLPVAGIYCYGEIAPGGVDKTPTYHSSTLVTLLLAEEPRPSTGLLSAQDAFSVANLAHDKQALAEALAASQAELADARYALTQCRELSRLSAHSKTERNSQYRALALGLVSEVLDTRFSDFKHLAMKGDPPRLNKVGLARLVNEQHIRQWQRPFPLTLAQLARLLAVPDDD